MAITSKCGSHCGIKDGIEGHCNCDDCHKGILAPSEQRISLKGKTLPRDFRGDV